MQHLHPGSALPPTCFFAGADAPPLREAFIAAMGRAVTGVNLVTTDGAAGHFGVTVSAVASVSADPPLLLACLNAQSPASNAILGNGSFCVNILATDQCHVADTFAGRPPDGLRPFDFACAEWDRTADTMWRLRGALATFDCALEHSLYAGSHLVLIGRVLRARQSPEKADAPALAYSRRAYGRHHPLAQEFPKGHAQ